MKYILIIGASSDIAKSLSHMYAKNGYNIYLAGRNIEELEKDKSNLEIRYSIQARALYLDLLKYSSHKDFLDNLNPKPHGIICVAGYLGDQKLAEKDFNESEKIINTNYTGCVSILNLVVEALEEEKNGFIIGISSCAGDRGRQSNYIYGSAKGAFSLYLSGLRNRLTKSNITVLTVKPGFVNTKMTAEMDLPDLLTAQPDEVALDIYKAQQKKKDIIYTKWFWTYIMLVIKHIPEFIFKKLKL
jgi:hypothetical protein